ncbi:hypothetical protein DRO91_08830 [Candidatus Heimdallarchaeota archaeon]|nr:MAG: hypothetical protein DRO91_08830 [Candidatus Heimdallarchaeota archaeon]
MLFFSGNTKTAVDEGKHLWVVFGEKAWEKVESYKPVLERECAAEIERCKERLNHLDQKSQELKKQLEKHGTGEPFEKVRFECRIAKVEMWISIFLALVASIVTMWTLLPSFYGNEFMVIPISLAVAGIMFLGMHLFLHLTSKLLSERWFNTFLTTITAVIVASVIAGGIFLSQARGVQMEVNDVMQASQEDVTSAYENSADVDSLLNKINKLNRASMALLFLGLEWVGGTMFFLSLRKMKKYKFDFELGSKLADTEREREYLINKINNLKNASGSIFQEVQKGIALASRNKGRGLAFLLIFIILGIVLGSFIFVSKVFGGQQCISYLIGFDTTGSTDYDRLQNERAVIKIISTLKPCDEIRVVNITEATFSNPEYLLDEQMPLRAGVFDREIRRKQARIASKFRQGISKVPKERPATSLIEGMTLLGYLIQERAGKKKVLIIISDMKQFKNNINPQTLAENGDRILQKLKSEGLIPDLSGVDVYVMGASTAGLDARTWLGIKRFWTNYFKAANANLKCYTIQRQWPYER